MSSEADTTEIAYDEEEETESEPTKAELMECIRGLEARLESVEKENKELREKIQEVDKSNISKTEGNHVLGSLLGVDVQDYQADIYQHKDAAEDFNETVDEIENTMKRIDSIVEEQGTPSGDTKEHAWQSVVDHAENLSSHKDHALRNNWVILHTKQIQSATSYSKRRCSQLIEEWGEQKEGTKWRPYERKAGSVQKKALKIDLDVWGSR